MQQQKTTIKESLFDAVTERMQQVLNTDKQKDVADALGISPGDFGNRKKREKLPYEQIVEWASKRNVNINWLFTGSGEIHKETSNLQEQALSSKEKALLELFKELSDEDQREICQDAAEKKRLADLEQQVKELALRLERLNSVG